MEIINESEEILNIIDELSDNDTRDILIKYLANEIEQQGEVIEELIEHNKMLTKKIKNVYELIDKVLDVADNVANLLEEEKSVKQ